MTKSESYNRVVAINVDVQNDFCPGGSLAVANGDEVINPLNVVNHWIRDHNGTVVFTRDWHPYSTKHFGNPPDYVNTWPVHCVQDTLGAAFKNNLEIESDDLIISKGMSPEDDGYSGFSGISDKGDTLASIIVPRKAEKVAVVIGGLATDYCVKATVMDALSFIKRTRYGFSKDLGVFVLNDAIEAVNTNSGYQSIEAMKNYGAVFVDSQQVINDQVIKIES